MHGQAIDNDVEVNDQDFLNRTSNSSTSVSDIQSIVFGGVRSRFWLLRKHFNSMSVLELQDIPFHSW